MKMTTESLGTECKLLGTTHTVLLLHKSRPRLDRILSEMTSSFEGSFFIMTQFFTSTRSES